MLCFQMICSYWGALIVFNFFMGRFYNDFPFPVKDYLMRYSPLLSLLLKFNALEKCSSTTLAVSPE